jgi:hypothetical protein
MAYVPPAIDSSLQGAPGAQQNPLAPQLAGVQAQQPIPVPQPQQPGAINPALAASILALNSQQSQQGGIDRSRKMADAMRGDARDQLQGQQVGRVYKSSTLANLAASLAASYGAQRMNANANTAQTAMDAQRQAAMQKYFDALTSPSAPAAAGGAGNS